MRSNLDGATDWTNFVYDEVSGELIAEYSFNSSTFALESVNTWGLGLISTRRGADTRFFHFDAVGSTAALTDESEDVTDTYRYNAFGVLQDSTGTSVNPFRYVGRYGYYDDGAMGGESGLSLLGVRYYSPGEGRFWSWDPVPFANLYAYCDNSPTMTVDPTGAIPALCLIACGGCLACIGSGIGACLDCRFDGGCWARCIQGVTSDMSGFAAIACGLACTGCIACLFRRPTWIGGSQRSGTSNNNS